MNVGDKVVCIYNEIDELYDDSIKNCKLLLNKTYTIADTYYDTRDDVCYYIFLNEKIGYSFNNRRFMPLTNLRKEKITRLLNKKNV